jgi:uncharacterized membrane protein
MGSQSWAAAWPFVVVWFSFKIAVWALVITALVYGLRRLRHGACGAVPTPLEILKARYARGELTRQDFESMRRDLDS